ncbi:exo-alpha-sialidase [Novipirellula sp. SH528]|uniref:exo-alpha-sialidase n=1 Tax=Novipirellula sp. SH528 TaxID=3454466 RepID=UPI003FA0F0CE
MCALTLSSFAAADEPQWKLQPLQYNNPGLKVDLGVGLWAFPLPMDYDNDGDLDLLVSCPDKPSNGTYFFENPSQDPNEKMPVFKAGVRIGSGSHFMQMSVVDGEPILMLPAKEFRRDAKTGKFDFSKPTMIKAHANPNHHTKGNTRANMWRYVDYDGDGDQDIVVGSGDWTDYSWDHAYDNHGNWRNGPLHGYVYLIENEGSDDEPTYSAEPERLQAGGGEIDVYGFPSPNFADFDNDGDLDLLCGEFLDGFTYFQNIGTRTKPNYAAGQKLNDVSGDPLVMHLQMITPTAVDWDADGDLDLIVGDEDGRVALVENTGELRDHQPVFKAPAYFQQQADTLKFGALATPFAYDWDNDGDEDIVCGNTAGSIGYFENLGNAENGLPKWAAPKLLEVKQNDGSQKPFRVMAGPSGSIQGPAEAKWGYTTLSVADWDGDGDGDIVYNSILSRLGMLTNESGTLVEKNFDTGQREAPPKWYWWQTLSSSALTQWRTTPMAIDFDGDKKLDLVMLDQEGYLTLRSGGGVAERIFIDENGQPLQLNSGTCGRSGRVKLQVVDWDGDSRLDVLVNSENATWYRNCADVDGKVMLKKVGNLAKRNVAGHTSSPTVCDFNKDGKPDLIVGSENGRIYHVAHDDCVTFTSEETMPSEPKAANEPAFPGLLSSEFIFKDAPFKECHASTICQTSRGLVASWFGGTKEGNKDVAIWTSFHDGLSWSRPLNVADGVQHDGMRHPCWNPVLYQPPGDAPLFLFFKVGPRPHSWWGEVMISYDRGRTFTDRKRLPEGIDGPVRCKPILLDDGKTLLCGSSTENEGWRVHFEKITLVDGELSGTWKRIGPINDGKEFSAIQPTLLTYPDGRLQALCRTKESVIASTESTDGGDTWSKLVATDMPNPNSGIDVVTLTDGRQLMIYNHLGSSENGWGKRSILNLAISEDGGKWKEVGVLEKEKSGEFSYPAIIQTDDGMVHMTYTWKRKLIKHAVVDPSQLK